jgi:hypothetical protein
LCQVSDWLKFGPVVWRKGFVKDPTILLHFCYYLLFEENLTLYLKKKKYPFIQGQFVPSLIEFG